MERLVLQLNASCEPMSIIPWQRAMELYFKDRVEIVEEYQDFDITSMRFTMKCPSVIRLLKYVQKDQRRAKFSKFSVFCRDNFQCQYCGIQPGSMKLTMDHVLPKSRGGRTSWENIATACQPCNGRKDNRTPEEAGMHLKREPFKPEITPFQFRLTIPRTPEAWASYVEPWLKHD